MQFLNEIHPLESNVFTFQDIANGTNPDKKILKSLIKQFIEFNSDDKFNSLIYLTTHNPNFSSNKQSDLLVLRPIHFTDGYQLMRNKNITMELFNKEFKTLKVTEINLFDEDEVYFKFIDKGSEDHKILSLSFKVKESKEDDENYSLDELNEFEIKILHYSFDIKSDIKRIIWDIDEQLQNHGIHSVCPFTIKYNGKEVLCHHFVIKLSENCMLSPCNIRYKYLYNQGLKTSAEEYFRKKMRIAMKMITNTDDLGSYEKLIKDYDEHKTYIVLDDDGLIIDALKNKLLTEDNPHRIII
jgi:hypothetical protein